MAHLSLDFCLDTSKERVCDSVAEKGREEEPLSHEMAVKTVLETTVEKCKTHKGASVNADPHLGSTHCTSDSFRESPIFTPVTVCAVGRLVYCTEET